MIERTLENKLLELSGKFPIVSVTGPRQSGKSTLIRHAFPGYEYLSFEEPETREFFELDPKRFLQRNQSHVIFDEAQRVPELFSYLQGMVDRSNLPGQFILSGSQNFLLSKGISQSLAGRVGILRLLPLSLDELTTGGYRPLNHFDWVYRGCYPRVFSASIEPYDYYPAYIETYLERDVRAELGVAKIEEFGRFLSLCASQCGELLNIASLARDCGISTQTARSWLSVLSSSYVLFQLAPYFKNAGKRLTKTPKLYFYDTGLACSLLGLETAEEVESYAKAGNLFENAVVAELAKSAFNKGRAPQFSFWRDSNKREVDVIMEKGLRPVRALEIKSSSTFRNKFFDTIRTVAIGELGLDTERCAVVYGGEETLETPFGALVSYRDVASKLTW